MSRGVYFLADDDVIDFALAFLNSFRKHNPDIPLCLIPFNRNIKQVSELRHKYGFSIYTNDTTLARCDEISERFHKKVIGHYRKLATWEGGFDEFIYIDIDTVVLRNVSFAFRFLSEFDFIAATSDAPSMVKEVWKPSIYASGQLTSSQIAFAANTGFITSKKGSLTLDGAFSKLEHALSLASHMCLFCIEQPFLNYLMVTSGRKYTSLRQLSMVGQFPEFLFESWAGHRLEAWASRKLGVPVSRLGGVILTKDGEVILSDGTPFPSFFLHWAGVHKPRLFDEIVFFVLRMLHIRKKNERLVVRFFMRYREIWNYYRFLR